VRPILTRTMNRQPSPASRAMPEALIKGQAPGKMLVRKMRPDDLPGALQILGLWNMAPRAPSSEVPDPERTSIEIDNAFVAEAGGRIVGTCSYFLLGDGWAETASLAVDPEPPFAGVGVLLQQA
jgi:N-acetylglutamate synthase-like GNAT family acetyltransferase